MKKRIFSLITIASLLSSQLNVYAAEGIYYEDSLYASVRDVYTELGYDVQWDAENEQAVIDTGSGKIELPKNVSYSVTDGEATDYEYGGQIIFNDRLFTPAEFIAKSLGTTVEFDEDGGLITANGAESYISAAENAEENYEPDFNFDWSKGKPWVTSNLKETIDPNVSLKDDFSMAVTGQWVLDNTIPAGMTSRYVEADVEDEVQKNIMTILTSTPRNHEEKLLQQLYSAILDFDARADYIEPEAEMIKEIADIADLDELSEYITGYEGALPDSTFISCTINPDIYDNSRYVLNITPPSLELGDSSEYEELSDYAFKNYNCRKELNNKLMTHLGFESDKADEIFLNSFEWENLFADTIPTSDELSDPDDVEKYMTVADLDDLYSRCGDFPLKDMLENCGFDKSEIVYEYIPDYFDRLGEIYTEENLEYLKSKLIVSILYIDCNYLDKESLDYYNDYYYQMTGIEPVSIEKDAAETVRYTMTFTLANAYIQRYGDKKIKDDVTKLCREIIDEYKIMLSEEDWLSEATRKKAIEKLDNMNFQVGWPDKFPDVSDLDFTGCDYNEIISKIADRSRDIIISRINGQVDKTEWTDDPLAANAYNSQNTNSMAILWAEILAFYSADSSKENLYATLGASVIGHEISHSFDVIGSKFDKDGNKKDWWTDEDRAAFEKRSAKLIEYYDNIIPYEGGIYSGKFIRDEAIADMGGLQCVLRIAKKHKDFDYDTFFREYARAWEQLTTPYNEYILTISDPHPLAYLRTNVTLQQFDEFLDTYDIKEGDGMYLAPEGRIKVW